MTFSGLIKADLRAADDARNRWQPESVGYIRRKPLSLSPVATAKILEKQVREHLERYSMRAEVSAELRRESQRLGELLGSSGGIETVLYRNRVEFDPVAKQPHQHHLLSRQISQMPYSA